MEVNDIFVFIACFKHINSILSKFHNLFLKFLEFSLPTLYIFSVFGLDFANIAFFFYILFIIHPQTVTYAFHFIIM
jgi:hypothetical protein